MAEATLLGFPAKYLSLATLVIQNSMLVLIMKYSRNTGSEESYLASTAVMLSEIAKLIICLAMHLAEQPAPFSPLRLCHDLFGSESDAWKMMVPAGIYVVQNNLQYLAVSNLDPASFQVSYQFKIITTAVFSVLMLKRTLTRQKWFSLICLTLGIALVQIPSGESASPSKHTGLQNVIGLLAVAVACILSGLAGVWFEKVLKGSKASLWLRNTQLSFFSLIPALLGVCVMDGAFISKNGFFHGYSVWTFATIACQALGGLIVSLVVKYADNILKGFATSISIILSAIASIFLFGFSPSLLFITGASIVLYATHLYGLPDIPTAATYVKLKPEDGA